MRLRLETIDEDGGSVRNGGREGVRNGVRVCKVETEKCPGQESGPVLRHLFLPAV